MAATLLNLGNVYAVTGSRVRALSLLQRALDHFQATGDRHGAATSLTNIGNVHHERGDHEEARGFYERALAVREAIGDVPGTAAVLANLAVAHEFLGEHTKALAVAKRAQELFTTLGKRQDIASGRGNIAVLRLKAGDEGAVEELDQAIREARWLRAAPLLVRLLRYMGMYRLDSGKPALALERAREAVRQVEALSAGLGGLGDATSASARAEHAAIYGIGTLAAVALERLPEAFTFLEDGRAGALLEALGGRQAMDWSTLPAELRATEAHARRQHTAARADYETAIEGGGLDQRRKAAARLDVALQGLRAVTERIQREAKREASVFYPRAAPLEEIQRSLAVDQAFVLYAFCLDEVIAFVVTRETARAVPLGAAVDLAALIADVRLDDAEADPTQRIAQWRARLVRPLELAAATKHVLISPDGPLGYVPFGALFDVPVTLTPSGTTHAWLRGERRPGRGSKVLALGDPDYRGVLPQARAVYYRGRKLVPLPATRKEVEAIGQTVLLGGDATEAGLRNALGKERSWRAVHFACHGLVDPERPDVSSLALSAANGEDGFLTSIDVLRLRIPTDLVVLSACETATGHVIAGEGIVGLTRAFMFAGAPRVICSLWKVDDEATQALMTKFYELWNPKDGGAGLGAAAALRQAQAFVRSREKWRHPYYWAAWVLWGLPD